MPDQVSQRPSSRQNGHRGGDDRDFHYRKEFQRELELADIDGLAVCRRSVAMPLILEAFNPGKGSWQLARPPRRIDGEEYYWVNRFTNEVFTSYEKYITRMELYQSQIWSCRLSGKSNLTYEQALQSEEEVLETISIIPENVIPILLEMIHGSPDYLEALVAKIGSRLRWVFSSGDSVKWQGKVVLVHEVVKEGSPTDSNNFPEFGRTYRVSWVDRKRNEHDQEVPGNRLNRIPQITNFIIRCKIRDVAVRPRVKGAPWVVSDVLLKKYGVKIDLPYEVQELLQDYEDRKSRKRKRAFDDSSSEEDREEREERKKRKKEEKEKQLSKAEEREREREERRAEKEAKRARERMYPMEDLMLLRLERQTTPKAPPTSMEDYSSIPKGSELDFLNVWRFLTFFGKPLCLSPFSLDDFVKAIVHAGDDSLILIEEIFYSLLNALAPKKALTLQNWEPHLRRYLIHSSKEAQSKLKAKEKDEDPGSDVDDTEENLNENGKGSSDGNGDAKMEDADEDEEIDEGGNVSALAGEREKLAYAIRTTTWNRMEASDKIAILQFLCDDILDPEITETVRVYLDNALEKRSSLQKERWATTRDMHQNVKKIDNDIKEQEQETAEDVDAAISESRDKTRQIENDLKKLKKLQKVRTYQQQQLDKKTEAFSRQIAKCLVREHPIGYDRWFNRYWYFPEIPEKLIVESSGYFTRETQEALTSKVEGSTRPIAEGDLAILPCRAAEESAITYYDTKEQIWALMESLNQNGVRERRLHKKLTDLYNKMILHMNRKQNELLMQHAEGGIRRSARKKTGESSRGEENVKYYVNRYAVGR